MRRWLGIHIPVGMEQSSAFDRFARTVARASGSQWASLGAVALIGAWALSGPVLGFSQTWQLIANTGTTIVTFLMVFLIQNTQLNDTAEIKAMLREMTEDLSEVDEQHARDRVTDEK